MQAEAHCPAWRAASDASAGKTRVDSRNGAIAMESRPAYQDIIALDPGKRSGKPTIRGMRITVYDVLSYLAAGMSIQEILADFPYLTEEDIRACLSFAAEREWQVALAHAY